MKKRSPDPYIDRTGFIVGILCVIVVVVGILFFSGRKFQTPKPPPREIPHGKIEFTVSQSDNTAPQFGKGFIDPYDPAKGETQTVVISVKHNRPVMNVTAVLKTDHKTSSPVPFALISGTNTNGQWRGSWRVTDTYLYTYNIVLKAESSRENPASVEITLR